MWFSQRRGELLARRERLRLRSAELRLRIAGDAQVLRSPLALADQVRSGVHWLRTHPEWPLGALVMVVIVRPRRALRWAGKLWWGWRLWRRAQRALALLAQAQR